MLSLSRFPTPAGVILTLAIRRQAPSTVYHINSYCNSVGNTPPCAWFQTVCVQSSFMVTGNIASSLQSKLITDKMLHNIKVPPPYWSVYHCRNVVCSVP